MRKLAICNHKGGVGKTSLTTHLAGALAELGQRVLLVDADSQGDLSALFLPAPGSLRYTVADLFSGAGILAQDVVQPTACPGICILPADHRLAGVDRTHGYAGLAEASAIADAVTELAGRYDVVLVDCPPRPHLTGFAALAAAGQVLVPVQPSQFSVRALATLHDEIGLVQSGLNPALRLRGYVLSMVPARSAAQAKLRQMLVEAFGADQVLRTAVPVMASLDSAINRAMPITRHAPRSKAAAIIRSLAGEICGLSPAKVRAA